MSQNWAKRVLMFSSKIIKTVWLIKTCTLVALFLFQNQTLRRVWRYFCRSYVPLISFFPSVVSSIGLQVNEMQMWKDLYPPHLEEKRHVRCLAYSLSSLSPPPSLSNSSPLSSWQLCIFECTYHHQDYKHNLMRMTHSLPQYNFEPSITLLLHIQTAVLVLHVACTFSVTHLVSEVTRLYAKNKQTNKTTLFLKQLFV